MCTTYSREAWIEGPVGGRERDSTRNEIGLEREMNKMSRDALECVYARGGDRGTRTIFCVVFVLVCVGVRR